MAVDAVALTDGALLFRQSPVLAAAAFYLTVCSLLLSHNGAQAEVIVFDLNSNDTADIFPDMEAGFGVDFPSNGLQGRTIFASPRTACEAIRPAPPQSDLYCWIVVIARGDCEFTEKIKAAQEAGFMAAIVYNYKDRQGITKMGGDSDGIRISSTFVGYKDGMDLGTIYNYQHMDYMVEIREPQQIDYRMYLWPFAIVVGVCFLVIILFVVFKFVRDQRRHRVSRLSKRHLKKIPIRKFKKGQYYDTCAICLEEYEDGEKIRVLPCDHAYHTKCIDPWLTRNKKTCPVCKRRVMPGKDPNSEGSGSDSDGGSGAASSQTTPLLLNSSNRMHGSLNVGENDRVRAPRSQSAPATFEAAVVIEKEEGAVGGVDLSALPEEAASSSSLSPSAVRDGAKRKRRDRREEASASMEAEEEEERRKAEKKERRRKKKERRRREERQSREDGDEGDETSRLLSVEEAGGDLMTPGGLDGGVAVGGGRDDLRGKEDMVAVADKEDNDTSSGFVNPSYLETPEAVALGKNKKRELSEVV